MPGMACSHLVATVEENYRVSCRGLWFDDTHGDWVNPAGSERMGSIGYPVPSTDMRLVDDEGNEVPQGENGEIQIKGPQVMKGYYNKPEETAKAIKDGWFNSGDIGMMEADGYFRIVDRKKDMILVSGFNVYPNEMKMLP